MPFAFLALIAGLVLRFATQLHTLGDVLIGVGGFFTVLPLLFVMGFVSLFARR